MFGRIKKWIAEASESLQGTDGLEPVEAWAQAQGLAFERMADSAGFALLGDTAGRPWHLHCGPTGRDFIADQELRLWAALDLDPEITVMLLNRPLKEALEQRAFEQVTHGLQTVVDRELPTEARWLALYDQVGWSSAPLAFWDRYAIVAETRNQAQQWLEGPMLPLLMDWPTPAVQQMTPFILQLHRGWVELRMEYAQIELATLEHACKLFLQACSSARLLGSAG